MKKNSKGFFLAETIVMVALVTTVMAFVYPNVSKIYDNYKNQALYYDQTEDIYLLKAYHLSAIDYMSDKSFGRYDDFKVYYNKYFCEGGSQKSNISLDNMLPLYPENPKNDTPEAYNQGYIGEDEIYIYISKYMSTPKDNNYNFNKYLKRLKKTTYDNDAFRIILKKFDAQKEVWSYASIKVDDLNYICDKFK